MTFSVNNSPLAGTEGDKVTSRVIAARLAREAETNVAIHVSHTDSTDSFEVAGRGELQLGVLIEQMRREGFELAISRPRVLTQTDPTTGKKLEPIEEVVIDLDEQYSGVVVEKMSLRKAEMTEMRPSGTRAPAPVVPGAVARVDRLSRRVFDRHPRHRADVPHLPRLWSVARPGRGPPQRRADLECVG